MIGQGHDLELTLQNLQKWTYVKNKTKKIQNKKEISSNLGYIVASFISRDK